MFKKLSIFVDPELRRLIEKDPSWANSKALQRGLDLPAFLVRHFLVKHTRSGYSGPEVLRDYLCTGGKGYQLLCVYFAQASRIEATLEVQWPQEKRQIMVTFSLYAKGRGDSLCDFFVWTDDSDSGYPGLHRLICNQ